MRRGRLASNLEGKSSRLWWMPGSYQHWDPEGGQAEAEVSRLCNLGGIGFIRDLGMSVTVCVCE